MTELLPQHLQNVKGVGIVVIRNGLILLGKRKDSGAWGLAGGSIEEGETPKEAAIRELREEFGIDEPYLRYFGISYSPPNPYKAKDSTEGCSIDFFVEYSPWENVDIKLEPTEMTEYKWVPFKDVLSMTLYPSSRSSLETFLRK